jgi:hypothetical protein
MRVRQLIEFLSKLPQDAQVHVDDEHQAAFPSVDGCYVPDKEEFDELPSNVVVLELTYPKEDE